MLLACFLQHRLPKYTGSAGHRWRKYPVWGDVALSWHCDLFIWSGLFAHLASICAAFSLYVGLWGQATIPFVSTPARSAQTYLQCKSPSGKTYPDLGALTLQ